MMPELPTTDGHEAEPPRYRSHKEVWAVKITDIDLRRNGAVMLSLEAPYAPVPVEHDMVRRYMPVAGDFLMMYPDGYRSISPKSAFEDGYTRIE